MKRTLDSFKFAWNGLKTVWREEVNFRIEVLAGLLVTFCLVYFQFSFEESAFCLLAVTIVLCSEIINTVVEDLCNKVQLNHDPVIGKIKDMMASFVFVSCLGALITGLIVFSHHFF